MEIVETAALIQSLVQDIGGQQPRADIMWEGEEYQTPDNPDMGMVDN